MGPLRPDLSCDPALSANKPDRLVSISVRLVYFREKRVFFDGHFAMLPFVFIHIPGGSFIFNIFLGQSPVSDLD
jgi:hypothetical protein